MRRLVLTDQAKLDFNALDRPTRVRVAAAIQRMIQTSTGNIKRLQGTDPPEYRLRVGDWRIRFSYPDPGTVRVNRILNRKEAYR